MKSLTPKSSSRSAQKTLELKKYMAKQRDEYLMEDESKQGTVATLTTEGSDESFRTSAPRSNIPHTPVAGRAYLGGFTGGARSTRSSFSSGTATPGSRSTRFPFSDGSSTRTGRSELTNALSQGLWDFEPETSGARTTNTSMSTGIATNQERKSRKGKKKSKKKSEKKEKKKKERKQSRSASSPTRPSSTESSKVESIGSDDEEDVLTARDKAMVDSICNIFSETLSSAENKQSFLRLLRDETARSIAPSAHSAPTVKAGSEDPEVEPARSVCDSPYSQLQSPDSSVCGELPTETNPLNLQELFPKLEQAQSVAESEIDPPSVAAPSVATPSISSIKPSGEAKLPASVAPAIAGAAPVTSLDPATASAEQLFLALPSHFREYLFHLHKQESIEPNAPPVQEITGRVDRDCMSVVSEMSGLTSAFVQRVNDEDEYENDSDSEDGRDSNSNQDNWSSSIDKGSRGSSSQEGKKNARKNQNDFVQFVPPPPADASYITVGSDSVGPHSHTKQVRRSSLMQTTADGTSLRSVRSEKKPTVKFSSVVIREYNTVPSDNPGCSEGPALELGWNFRKHDMVICIDEHNKRPRKGREELILSKKTREAILFRLGYTHEEVNKSVRRLNRHKSQRRRTIHNLGAQNVEYAMERVGRRFKSLLTNKPEDDDITKPPADKSDSKSERS